MNEKIGGSALERIVEIDKLFQDGRLPTMRYLTDRFGVSSRTIHRDFELMRDIFNAEIVYNRSENGWCYANPKFKLFPATLSEDELFAILVSSKVLEEYKGTPYEERLTLAFHRIMSYFREEITLQLKEDMDAFSFRLKRGREIDEKLFASLSKAISERLECEIIYHSFCRDEINERVIQPYHLINILGDWYLIAYCKLRDAFRTFSLMRIMSCNITRRYFPRDSQFNISEYLTDSLVLEKGDEPVDIAIEFDANQARWIMEKIWHPTQEILERDDGSILLRITVSSLDEVKRWVLTFGEHARVILPVELVGSIKETIKGMADRYRVE